MKITETQKEMIDNWIKDASKEGLTDKEAVSLDKKISMIINNVDGNQIVSYFPRIRT